MPKRPKSHSELLGRASSDAEYDRHRRESRVVVEEIPIDADGPRRRGASLSMARQLRHAKRWEKCRKIVLKRNPLCVDPYGWHAADGRVILAEQVDHIVSLRERPDLAYVIANMQGLCTQCHATKSQEERLTVQSNPRSSYR